MTVSGLRKSALLIGSILSAPLPAFAQDVPPEEAIATSDNPGDIIVTARRTEERLQDVPISITVVTSEEITNRNITSAQDLATFVPSLATNANFGAEKSSFVIRGFVQEGKTSPSVAVYFADVVAPRSNGGTTSGNGAGPGSFFDLQNVQVLKGPQGTLFGRNSTGGAILLVPQKPTHDLEGYVEGSLGSYNMHRVQAAVNIPLSDTFRVRAAVDWHERDGYLRNRSGIGPDDFADLNYVATRLSIVGDLTPDLENYTIFSWSRSRNNGSVAGLRACNRDAAELFVTTPPPANQAYLLPFLGCGQIDRQIARGDGFWDIENNNAIPFQRVEQWQVINTTTWRASDTLTVKNIASYAEYREQASFSLWGDNLIFTPFPGFDVPIRTIQLHPGFSGDNSAQSTFTEEIQFQGNSADGRLVWQAGAYLEVSKPLGFSSGLTEIFITCNDVYTYDCTPTATGAISAAQTKDSFNSKALYAQGTFDFTDQLSLTAGFRYTWDKMVSVGENMNIAVLAPGVPLFICQDATRFNGGDITIPKIVQNSSECNIQFEQSSSQPTWLIGVDYKPNDDMLLYAKYLRGYRQGGINTNNVGLEVWQPEKVDTYEVGAKLSWRGSMPGYFNIAGFYNDFTNQQLAINSVINRGPNGDPNLGHRGPVDYQGKIPNAQPIVNAGQSRIWGIEIDASIRPFPGFRLDVGYAYLNTQLQSITLPETPIYYAVLLPSAAPGEQLALSPRNRVTVTGSYTLPLDESIGEITLGASFTHTDAHPAVNQLISPNFHILKESNLLDVNASWRNMFGNPIDLSFFMTNVTNEKRILFPGGAYNTIGADGGHLNQPRMWGFRLRYRFGE
jgi:iron complex outermembrane recepter protein